MNEKWQSKEPYAADERWSSRPPVHSGSPAGYVDKVLTCVDCGKSFTFTVREQRLFARRGFADPKRCYACRRSRRWQLRKDIKTLEQPKEKSRSKNRAAIAALICLLFFGVLVFWITNNFAPDTEPPVAPTLVSPEDKFITEKHIITLEWSKIEDRSRVKYEIQVDDDAAFSSPEFAKCNIRNCAATTNQLDDGIYYWRVRSIDRAGNVSQWSQTRRFWCHTQPPYAKTLGGERINLKNNWDAKDPTWQQLVSFLRADKTDSKLYTYFSFACGAFAEEVHNNAEAAGIRAAWVIVHFEDRDGQHALNAFNTTDRGLVYIDCTGEDIMSIATRLAQTSTYRRTVPAVERDKVAYVAVGKEYGLISLSRATATDYTFYEQMRNRWSRYEAKVQEYVHLVGGRSVVYDFEEYTRLKKMYEELKQMEEELGGCWWQPLGIVKAIEIYW